MNAELLASLYAFFVLLGVVVAILWVLLPFAVFGLKSRIDELIRIEKLQLENLRALRAQLVDRAEPPAPLSAASGTEPVNALSEAMRRQQA